MHKTVFFTAMKRRNQMAYVKSVMENGDRIEGRENVSEHITMFFQNMLGTASTRRSTGREEIFNFDKALIVEQQLELFTAVEITGPCSSFHHLIF